MKPRIAISMGDPGGVGPEIILKALSDPQVTADIDTVVIGDTEIMSEAASLLPGKVQVDRLSSLDSIPAAQSGRIYVYNIEAAADNPYTRGGISPENGRISHDCIVTATRAVLGGKCDALCTAPIAKEALFQAGFTVPGHTELLAQLCDRDAVRMMLVGGGLRVVLQTIHVALKDVPQLINPEGIVESLYMISAFARNAGLQHPRIAVCGLNPHAGENGHFGTEEIDSILPAIERFQCDGVTVSGPLPADTVFHRALQGDFDFVLAMYHDQGLIPVKTIDFHGGVNVTVGLPIIRTSPDHGTAFDLAGKGIASPSSITAALKYAAALTRGQI